MRVRRRGAGSAIGPKVLAIWPAVWSHHRKLGDGGSLVLPLTDPLGGGEKDDDEEE